MKYRKLMLFKRVVCIGMAMLMIVNTQLPQVYAQINPISVVNMASAPSIPMLSGIKIDPNNPFQLEFLVNSDPSNAMSEQQFEQISMTQMKYFLAALTVPGEDMWVNLSPYESDRIIADEFGQTEMGRDMLAQDYLLKKLSSSLLHPDTQTGKAFWERVYQQAYEMYGTTEVPIDSFHKVWIMPDKAVVYEGDGAAYIVEATLKVMLEEDYLAFSHQSSVNIQNGNHQLTEKSLKIMREIVIPEVTRTVNESVDFVQLRQIYHALILSQWFKQTLISSTSPLQQQYINQRKVSGVDHQDNEAIPSLYDQYVTNVKEGMHQFVREEYDPLTDEMIPRKYFSGGVEFRDFAMATTNDDTSLPEENNIRKFDVNLADIDSATSSEDFKALVEEKKIKYILNLYHKGELDDIKHQQMLKEAGIDSEKLMLRLRETKDQELRSLLDNPALRATIYRRNVDNTPSKDGEKKFQQFQVDIDGKKFLIKQLNDVSMWERYRAHQSLLGEQLEGGATETLAAPYHVTRNLKIYIVREEDPLLIPYAVIQQDIPSLRDKIAKIKLEYADNSEKNTEAIRREIAKILNLFVSLVKNLSKQNLVPRLRGFLDSHGVIEDKEGNVLDVVTKNISDLSRLNTEGELEEGFLATEDARINLKAILDGEMLELMMQERMFDSGTSDGFRNFYDPEHILDPQSSRKQNFIISGTYPSLKEIKSEEFFLDIRRFLKRQPKKYRNAFLRPRNIHPNIVDAQHALVRKVLRGEQPPFFQDDWKKGIWVKDPYGEFRKLKVIKASEILQEQGDEISHMLFRALSDDRFEQYRSKFSNFFAQFGFPEYFQEQDIYFSILDDGSSEPLIMGAQFVQDLHKKVAVVSDFIEFDSQFRLMGSQLISFAVSDLTSRDSINAIAFSQEIIDEDYLPKQMRFELNEKSNPMKIDDIKIFIEYLEQDFIDRLRKLYAKSLDEDKEKIFTVLNDFLASEHGFNLIDPKSGRIKYADDFEPLELNDVTVLLVPHGEIVGDLKEAVGLSYDDHGEVTTEYKGQTVPLFSHTPLGREEVEKGAEIFWNQYGFAVDKKDVVFIRSDTGRTRETEEIFREYLKSRSDQNIPSVEIYDPLRMSLGIAEGKEKANIFKELPKEELIKTAAFFKFDALVRMGVGQKHNVGRIKGESQLQHLKNLYDMWTNVTRKHKGKVIVAFVSGNTVDNTDILAGIGRTSLGDNHIEWQVGGKRDFKRGRHINLNKRVSEKRKQQNEDPNDKAMVSSANQRQGGVDFNPANLNLDVQFDQNPVQFNFDANTTPKILNGLQPVIINMTPIHNLRLYLGSADTSANIS